MTEEEAKALGEALDKAHIALDKVALLLAEMVRMEMEHRRQVLARSPFIAALNATKPPPRP